MIVTFSVYCVGAYLKRISTESRGISATITRAEVILVTPIQIYVVSCVGPRVCVIIMIIVHI